MPPACLQCRSAFHRNPAWSFAPSDSGWLVDDVAFAVDVDSKFCALPSFFSSTAGATKIGTLYGSVISVFA